MNKDRRDFLHRSIWGLGLLIGASFFAPAAHIWVVPTDGMSPKKNSCAPAMPPSLPIFQGFLTGAWFIDEVSLDSGPVMSVLLYPPNLSSPWGAVQ